MARVCVVVTAALLAVASSQVLSGGDKTGRQLVQECGEAQPSRIVLPQSGVPLPNPRSKRASRHRIVGGQSVQQHHGRWTWMVLLGEEVDGRRRWTCGGTLISARTVLTAAHCVSGRDASALTARLGEHDTSTSGDATHTDVSVSRVTVHPDYRGNRQNDIALLQLSQSVEFTRRIQPACLPSANADHTGRSVNLAGWGITEFLGDVPPVLQEVKLTVVDEQQCERHYEVTSRSFQRHFPGGFQGTKLCANSADGTSKDACQGDSGGPLVFRTAGRRGRYQVIGVVSTGLGSTSMASSDVIGATFKTHCIKSSQDIEDDHLGSLCCTECPLLWAARMN